MPGGARACVRRCARTWHRGRAPRVGAVVALVLAWTAGCTLVTLDHESREYYASTVLVGRIDCPAGCEGPVLVAALAARGQGFGVAARTSLHEAGGYELIVPGGRYALFAFADNNRNGVFDVGEPSGGYRGETPVTAPGTGVVAGLDFVLRDGLAEANPPMLPGTRLMPAEAVANSTQAGAIADLRAPRFSAANGREGYWSPMTFFRESGGNVYFVEPYDPTRIPILFVHGAAGSAQDWRVFLDGIDRTRYQAWLFQYPSGASVESMAYLLYWKLINLQLRYHFDTLYLTAHSMGGLVTRRFLLDHGAQFPQIRLFVSLSTPWAGEPSADLGVRHSPAVIPSWRDMQPDGPFMRTLFERHLPASIDYYLIFGHRGGYSLVRPNHDGTVTLASQLRDPAQREAKRVFGFDEDHASILASAQVIAQFRSILDQTRGLRDGAPRGGMVRLEIRRDGDPDAPLPLAVLALFPEPTGQASPITIALSPDDLGREVGPVPAGAWRAAIIASSFRSEPPELPLVTGTDATARIAVRLVPDGMLSGYIAADADPASVAAGIYRPPHPTLRPDVITLEGAGVARRVVPRDDGAGQLFDAIAKRRDDAIGPAFVFVGLPAGDYTLRIQARGYRTFTRPIRVEPGLAAPLMPIVLEPVEPGLGQQPHPDR